MRMWAWLAVSVFGLAVVGSAEAGIQATADITSQTGVNYPYQYNLTLHNTGDTNISTFWYAWDDSDLNFLPSYPYAIQGPAGWIGLTTGSYFYDGGSYLYTYGIEWYAYGSPLAPGQDLPGFSFESYDTPEMLAGISNVPPVNPGDPPFPVGTSFVYMNYPAQQVDDPGFQFVVGAPAAAPEPAALGLLGMGMLTLLLRRR